MIKINRDELIKEKGKVTLNYNQQEILSILNVDKLCDLISELYLMYIERESINLND